MNSNKLAVLFAPNKLAGLLALGLAFFLISCVRYNLAHLKSDYDFLKAKQESDGYFDDIPGKEWNMMKERAKFVSPNTCLGPPNCKFKNKNAAYWLQNNFEPDFACRHEKRIGIMGDGGKWVCDPHRLSKSSRCLVYSVGSANDFTFEEAVKRDIGKHCEIHTFDPADYSEGARKAGVTYHQWGISDKTEEKKDMVFKTLKDTVKELGHTDLTIDIFKIDCEGCELRSVKTWIDSKEVKVSLHQVLVEDHLGRDSKVLDKAKHFMETMREYNYVIAHKEPNLISWFNFNTACVEYGFVKLNDSFFN